MRWLVARLVVFVAASTALTVWIAASITGFEVNDRYTLSAEFNDVAGLFSGNDVRLAGIPVGKVDSLKVVDGNAVVRFSVEDRLRLPRDTRAVVRWRNLIGQRFLSLEPGRSREMLDNGDKVVHTGDVVDLGNVVNQLAPLARSIGPDDLNRILTTLVAAFDGNDANFDSIVRDLGGLAKLLADRQALIGQVMTDYTKITSAVASRDASIAKMVTNLSTITKTIAASDGLISAAVANFATFSRNADRLLTASSDDLGGVLTKLAVLTDTAAQNVSHIKGAITSLPGMLEALQPTINRGAFLRVNLLCIAAGPGACPYPELFFKDESK